MKENMYDDEIIGYKKPRKKPSYISPWSWILTMILLVIPIVNIVYILFHLFGQGKQAKVSLIRAAFLVSLIMLIIWLALVGVYLGSFNDFMIFIDGEIKMIIEALKNYNPFRGI